MSKRFLSSGNLDLDISFSNIEINVFNIVMISADKNWQIAEHSHPYFKFNLVSKGKGSITLEEKVLEINDGDVFITGPYMNHSKISDPANPLTEYILECDIKPKQTKFSTHLSKGITENIILNTLSQPNLLTFKGTLGIVQSFKEIFSELKEKKPGYVEKIQSCIIRIIIDYYRLIAETTDTGLLYQLSEKNLNKIRIERLINFVELNYKNSITLADASKVLYLSTRQINRIMKEQLSMSFNQYLLHYRILAAKNLLENSMLSSDSIAVESGFSSYNTMYRAFIRNGNNAPGKLKAKNNG